MDALVQFIAAVVVALAATAFSHFGGGAEGVNLRPSEARYERAVKRTPAPQARLACDSAHA